MAIYGTCEECGRETRDYVCIGCTWEKLERLEAENALLQAVADAAEIIEAGKDLCGGPRPEDWIAFHAALAKLREHREGKG